MLYSSQSVIRTICLFLYFIVVETLEFDQFTNDTGVCGGPFWDLKPGTEEEDNFKVPINIFSISNVSMQRSESVHYSKIEVSSINNLDNLKNNAETCNGYYGKRNGSPVFFNCPCFYDASHSYIKGDPKRFCPRHIHFEHIYNVSDEKISTHTKDLLVIFNSWGTTSVYHVIFDTLFPLWATINQLHEAGVATDSVTCINQSPTCKSCPHQLTLQPLVQALFGKQSYNTPDLALLNSFNRTLLNDTLIYYKLMVFGFAYPWKPYYYELPVKTSPRIGRLLRLFRSALLNALLDNVSFKTIKKYAEEVPIPLVSYALPEIQEEHSVSDFLNVVFIHREYHEHRHPINNYDNFSRAFELVNIHLEIQSFGSGNLSTFEHQALFSSSKHRIIMGFEGAGFVQQLFSPLGNLLINNYTVIIPILYCHYL